MYLALALLLLPVTAGSVQFPDFTRIVERNLSSVATVRVEKRARKDARRAGTAAVPKVADDSRLKEFFGRFFDGRGGSGRKSAVGSGLVISRDGKLLTAAHLVKDAIKVRVELDGGKEHGAEIIGFDEDSDIALLRIRANRLKVPRIGDPGRLRAGEWVLSIGAPFGFERSVSQGIVSAVNRELSPGNPVRFLQTDVAVNPGNSGGPLFNTDGEVIGINTQIFSRSGGYQGVSFAVPIDTALAVARRLQGR